MSMYNDIFEDIAKDKSILELNDKVYRTDDSSIIDAAGFSNTSTTYNIKTKDPEKWLVPSNSFLKVAFRLTNSADNAVMTAGNIATLINGGMHLFDRARLLCDDNQIELVDKPGFVHMVEHLLFTSRDSLKTVAEDEWIFLDGGSIVSGAYTDSTAGLPARVLSTEFVGATAGVNEFYGLADPLEYARASQVKNDFMVGGWNPKFNPGFAARWCRAQSGRVVELSIPLVRIFGFFADIKSAFRGIQFEIELTKNTNYTEIIHGKGQYNTNVSFTAAVVGPPAVPAVPGGDKAAADATHVAITKLEWVIPTVIPSTEQLAQVQRLLSSDHRARKAFHSTTTYLQSFDHAVTGASGQYADYDWRIQTTGKKIVRVVVGFQRQAQYGTQNDPNFDARNNTNHANGGVFTRLDNIGAIELRFGNENYPKERYQRMDFTPTGTEFNEGGPSVLRNYVDMLNAAGRWDTEDGALVDYDSYRQIYPLFVWDMSNVDLTKAGVTSEDLRLLFTPKLTFGGAGQPPDGRFRVVCMVTYEYLVDTVGVKGRLAIEVQ